MTPRRREGRRRRRRRIRIRQQKAIVQFCKEAHIDLKKGIVWV